MRIILISFFFILLFNGCSFDNKTGIWTGTAQKASNEKKDIRKLKNNEKYAKNQKSISEARYNKVCKWGWFNPPECRYNRVENPKDSANVQFVKVFTNKEMFENEKTKDPNINILIEKPEKSSNWLQSGYNLSNNTPNLFFKLKKDIVLKSSKLSRSSLNENLLFSNNNIISSDHKGTIYVYSIENKKKSFQFNFYQKKYKKIKIKLYLTINNDIIYVSDNLGYAYAIDFKKNKIVWAKNFGVPFRSNIKSIGQQLILANQDNILYSLNTANGEKLWELPTSTTYLKSTFENSIAINKINNTVLFLNTSGELYSINYSNRNIDWVLNFKSSSGPSEDEIFFSFPLVLKNETLTVTTDKSVFVVNPLNGSKIWNQSIPVYKKPIFTEKNLFLISKNKYLMCLDSKNGNIIWSRNISNQINKKSKKIGTLEDFIMAENTLIIFSSNGFLISVNYKDGSVKSFKKLIKKGIKSKPIVVDGYLYVLNGSNKLLKIE